MYAYLKGLGKNGEFDWLRLHFLRYWKGGFYDRRPYVKILFSLDTMQLNKCIMYAYHFRYSYHSPGGCTRLSTRALLDTHPPEIRPLTSPQIFPTCTPNPHPNTQPTPVQSPEFSWTHIHTCTIRTSNPLFSIPQKTWPNQPFSLTPWFVCMYTRI